MLAKHALHLPMLLPWNIIACSETSDFIQLPSWQNFEPFPVVKWNSNKIQGQRLAVNLCRCIQFIVKQGEYYFVPWWSSWEDI